MDKQAAMSDYLFSGLNVLDVGTFIASPVAATILADLGADVIKIEQPGTGDVLRMLATVPQCPDADSNYFWQMDGRNKRSLTLDLKKPDGIEVLHKLVAECDVYITNTPFPARRALNLTYDDLQPLNPAMIYASLSAFGENGPDRDEKSFDAVAYWNRSGLMDMVRSPGAPPSQVLAAMGDHITSISLYACILTALLHRERTGEGSMVDTSLLANGLWAAAPVIQGALAGADLDKFRQTTSVVGATTRVYETRDKRWLQLSLVRTEEHFLMLLAALEATHLLEDVRFANPQAWQENRGELSDIIQEILRTRDSAEWLAIFESMELPVERVATLEEVVRDEQITTNEMAVPPVDDDMEVPLIVNHPINVSSVPQVGPKRAPELGEHTEQILDALGYSESQIQSFRDAGVV